MGVLRAIFGPSKDEIWSQIAKDIGGEFIDAGFWGTDVLNYRHGEWVIQLDTYTVSHDEYSTTYTRMRTPFVNSDGLRFKIYREGFFSSIGKFFKMQDIEIGDPFFDYQFIIKGNKEDVIKLLLNDPTLKNLIYQQPEILFEIRDDISEGDMLYFECPDVIKETLQLKALFEMFAVTLTRLVQLDPAYENNPNVELEINSPAAPTLKASKRDKSELEERLKRKREIAKRDKSELMEKLRQGVKKLKANPKKK